MNIVITGTSRGIGLELTRQALGRGDQVLAVARDAKGANLQKLHHDYPQLLNIVEADVAHPEAGSRITDALMNWSSVGVLVNNAGVFKNGTKREDFLESFVVNSIAPFEITTALLPWLKKSSAARAIHVTSFMGSIEDNGSGGYYAYRASKAALNMITKSLAHDHSWLTAIVIHPGWVMTDMGGEGAPVRVEDSAQGIWAVARNLKPSNSGKFFDFRGRLLPW